MGNTIESYRAAIGAFYSVTHKFLGRRSPCLNINARYYAYCTLNVFCLLSMASFVKNDAFKFYRFIILLIWMDIQELGNAGRKTESTKTMPYVQNSQK